MFENDKILLVSKEGVVKGWIKFPIKWKAKIKPNLYFLWEAKEYFFIRFIVQM